MAREGGKYVRDEPGGERRLVERTGWKPPAKEQKASQKRAGKDEQRGDAK